MNLRDRLINYEGSKAYQATKNYYRDGKFYPYKDSIGYWTIGYGKLIDGKQDQYKNGITESEANAFLDADIQTARKALTTIQRGALPPDIEDYLVIMIFQLGLAGTAKFRKLLAAAKEHNREGMRKESVDSLWYRQTPNRVKDMNKNLL